MGPIAPRTMIAEFRKRRRISLDGRVPGVLYGRANRGQQPASTPIDSPSRGASQHSYISNAPDAYEPHPGEMAFQGPAYTPYTAGPLRLSPDELPTHDSNTVEPAPVGPQIDRDLAAFLMSRFVNELAERPSPDVVPADCEVMLERPERSAVAEPILDQNPATTVFGEPYGLPTYDSGAMTQVVFDQLMLNVAKTSASPAQDALQQDRAYQDLSQELADLVWERDDGEAREAGTYESPDMACEGVNDIYEPDAHAPIGGDESPGQENPDAAPVGGDFATPEMDPLEQLADDAPLLEPNPMMEPQSHDDYELMDPWMMPGMGLMSPGSGPMGPLGPIM